jgi:AAA+ ATPase superfamily predicted ATPase
MWESSKATLMILFGRRRVGKTRLLTHWLQSHEDPGLYWVAEPASALTQLRSFSQALMSFIDPEAEVPPDFTFSTWEMALRQLARFAQERRIALFIDEVTYLIDVNPDFVGILQKTWDLWLSDSNLMLVLSGSQMGQMRKHLLDYDAALHGRATAQTQLPPLPYGTTLDYFPNYSARERVTLYAMWGGVPAYWERLDAKLPILENLRRNILPAHAWMVDESRILLQDFITDLHNYVGIMRAIADGEQAISDISSRTGLTSSKASFYLSVLRDTGFVARRVPVTKLGTDSRAGRYFVTDPYLRFFYRFMSAYQSKLALGQTQEMLELIQQGLPFFIENNSWKELCREWLLFSSAKGQIPVPVEEVGSEWAKNFNVDVVGISNSENSLVLGDCYWGDSPMGLIALDNLVRKTPTIIPKKDGEWAVYYTAFSASGWTDEAHAKAEELLAENGRRRRWRPVGIRLLDLEEVDHDLVRWSV